MQPNPPKHKPKRIIGIDFGMARIGLALSDERQIIASPFKTIQTERKGELTAAKVASALRDIESSLNCEIEEIVIGMPLMMSGKNGFLADEVKHFISLLTQVTIIPIRTWDERLSTVQAERSLREAQMTRKKDQKLSI